MDKVVIWVLLMVTAEWIEESKKESKGGRDNRFIMCITLTASADPKIVVRVC